MKRATITEAKNGLSALLDQVRAGETILILDRGVPVARIEPISASPDQTGRIERLVRAGVLRPGVGAPPLDLARRPGPRPKNGASIVQAVLDERESGW